MPRTKPSMLEEMQALAGVTHHRPGEFYDPRAVTEVRLGRLMSYGSYGTFHIFAAALAAVYRTAVAMRRTIEEVAFRDPRFEKSALALRDGVIQDLQDLAKAAGYAVDSGFGYQLTERASDDCMVAESGGGADLDTGLLLLLGDIARVKAMWKPVLAKLTDGSNDREFGSMNPDAIKRTVSEFVSKADGLLDKLRTGVMGLVADIAKADL